MARRTEETRNGAETEGSRITHRESSSIIISAGSTEINTKIHILQDFFWGTALGGTGGANVCGGLPGLGLGRSRGEDQEEMEPRINADRSGAAWP